MGILFGVSASRGYRHHLEWGYRHHMECSDNDSPWSPWRSEKEPEFFPPWPSSHQRAHMPIPPESEGNPERGLNIPQRPPSSGGCFCHHKPHHVPVEDERKQHESFWRFTDRVPFLRVRRRTWTFGMSWGKTTKVGPLSPASSQIIMTIRRDNTYYPL